MEKQGFNGKNEEPFIPKGLEYRDEHWQKALEGIIRHEKRTDRRRRAWIFSIVGGLLLLGTYAVLTQLSSPKEVVNSVQQIDSGTSANPESSASKPVIENKNVLPGKKEPPISSQNNAFTSREKSETSSADLNTTIPKNEAYSKPNDRSVEYDMQRNNADFGIESSMAGKPFIIEQHVIQGNDSSGSVFNSAGAIPTAEVVSATPVPFADAQTMDWDRNFRLPSISTLQLPMADQELQTPHTLRSDRNWTEPTWRIWAFAGSSLVTDFSSPLRDIRIDPMAGLRFEYNFNSRIFVDGGLEYFGISNVRRPYSQTSIAYDLNYQRTVTTVETHKLHYLSAPMHFGYRIARRHHVTLGFGISYMITGVNEIFQYKQTPTSNTLINHYDDSGFVAGFKDFPMNTEIGYTYKMGRNKSIRFAYQFGLTDITKNDYFNSSSFDRNSRFLIDLSIKLKSK